MIWAFTKIAVVTHNIGTGEAWLDVFGIMNLIGIGIFAVGAIDAIKMVCLRKSGPGDVLGLAPSEELRNRTGETDCRGDHRSFA
ncbi:MAG: hypothetical protein AAF668_07485 [Pseudomonadota bacterium]